jgi:hypothetical protein
MHEFGRGLPVETQQKINGVLNVAEETLKSDDPATIQGALDEAEKAAAELTEALMAAV